MPMLTLSAHIPTAVVLFALLSFFSPNIASVFCKPEMLEKNTEKREQIITKKNRANKCNHRMNVSLF